MKDNKPDGYCAWHPKSGWSVTTLSCTKPEAYHSNLVNEGLDITEDWQIKSVWLLSEERMKELLDYEFMYKSLEK